MNAARCLRKVLKSPMRRGVIRRQTQGRVDARRVHRALRGQRDFRKKTWSQDGFTTCVTVVLDMSSSMTSSAPVLQASTRALCKVLEQAGNPYSVYGFTNPGDIYDTKPTGRYTSRNVESQYTYTGRLMSAKGRDTSARFDATHYCALWEIIGERENMRSREDALRRINPYNCTASTPDAPALIGAIDMCRRMKGDRHIVIMLTDGAGEGRGYIKHATRYANTVGVETVGIAFNSNHVKDGDGQYNASVTCHTPRHKGGAKYVKVADALTSGFFKSLTSQLKKGAVSKGVVVH